MSDAKLNKIERLKQKCQASEYRSELAGVDWKNVDDETRFYLKNFGIYNIKLRPEIFMIRIRIDGGQITLVTLEKIAEIAEKYSLKIILTSRAQVELHDIAAEHVYTVYQRLQSDHIETVQTLTDNFRAIVCDPYDGVANDSFITCFPIISEIRQMILNNPSWMGTIPRKFNTALIGREKPLVNPWGNDLLFALAKKEGRVGFNVYLGGKNSEVAKSVNIFVLAENVPKLFESVALTYHTYGPRGSRSKTRMFHLIENAGMDQVRIWIENVYGRELESSGVLHMSASEYRGETVLKNSTSGSIYTTRYGESSVDELREMLVLAKQYQAEIRLGADQNFHMIPSSGSIVSPANAETLLTACAGSRYCPLSLWDIKQDISELPIEDLKTYQISLGFSGCLKGCGRHYHSDIGLIGLRTNLYGETEKAFRIFLGATQSPVAVPSRMLYYSVPLRCSQSLFDVILEDFKLSGYTSFSNFSHAVLNRYEIELLQLWYLFRQCFSSESLLLLNLFLDTSEGTKSIELFSEIKALADQKEVTEYNELTRILSHQLWDQ